VKPDRRFLGRSLRFWGNAKFLSEQIGYSQRGSRQLRHYTAQEARSVLIKSDLFARSHLTANDKLIAEVIEYLNWRADVLNQTVAPLFMNREQAAVEFEMVRARTRPTKPPPMNKQKGEKRHPAYLASLVGMIAESVLGPTGFIDDARRLSVLTRDNILEGVFSRRFDGAIPDTKNPRAVWEIKEYYGTTTFGSRVADGVYEALLDGYEIEAARRELGVGIAHFLFIDDRYTWWECGRSYLCRMIDMLHTGHVDQIFFGREVLTEWEKALRDLNL
jgi:hypothetical protein